ncbi:MAG: APC family permease [Acidobacteriota bacterium]
MSTSPAGAAGAGSLRRALTLRDLVLYGVIVIQPTAPMSVFGVLSERGQGHVVTTVLIAMVAMLLTAISYGRMARAYPSAGSAFTYVGQEIHPAAGYVTGWSMAMDYMLNPMVCIIWCSKALVNFAPQVPYALFAFLFFLLFTTLNLRGIKTSARVNTGLAAGMSVVIVIFFVAVVRYLLGHPPAGPAEFTRPFFDPTTFHAGAVLGGTSIAVLTYIGFDGISTLSEEVENPRRNVLLATVLTCLTIGILSSLQVYAAQLIWPAAERFPDVDTAFVHVAGRAAGSWFFGVVTVTLLVANVGSGMGGQLGAARLLYGMGRSNALPASFFGVIEPKRGIPRNNVLFVGIVALCGSFLVSFALGVELLNFGALIAFMGVNLAAFVRYYLRESEKKMINLFPPLLGFVVCFVLWLNLSRTAKLAGAVWLLGGVAFGAWKTRGFRGHLVNFDLPNESEVEKSPVSGGAV